jgi:FixJ family two-component response regulator
VVDDDTAVRTAIDLLLNAAGYCVTSFASAEQFLEADIRNPAACLVLDLRMPGKSGLELQTILTERGIHLPIIFLSGHGDVAAAARAVRSGAVDFLEKPFEPDTLLARVREALARAQVDETNREARNDVGEKLAILTPHEREVI